MGELSSLARQSLLCHIWGGHPQRGATTLTWRCSWDTWRRPGCIPDHVPVSHTVPTPTYAHTYAYTLTYAHTHRPQRTPPSSGHCDHKVAGTSVKTRSLGRRLSPFTRWGV